MPDESTVSMNSGYLVPCVFKAVQMIEALRETRAGLRVEDLLAMTGYSRSTIYRILRTLTVCGYIIRGAGGYYRLNQAVIVTADAAARNKREVSQFGRHLQASDRNVGFERWGVQFHDNGTRMNTHFRKTQRAVSEVDEPKETAIAISGGVLRKCSVT